VGPRGWGCDSPTLSAHEEALPDQEWLSDLLDGLALFANRDRKGRQSYRTTPEPAAHGIKNRAIQSIETELVHLVQLERILCDLARHSPIGSNLGIVAHPAEQPVRDARSAARAAGDLDSADWIQWDRKQLGGAVQDVLQCCGVVEIELSGETEAISQWSGQ
jgi:hypothetical protein